MANFFQQLMKRSILVMKFNLCGVLMINYSNHILLVCDLYCCSKHNLSTILNLIANVENPVCFVTLTFWFKTSFNVFVYFISIYCKISKISPGAYIFQRSFSRGLLLEGLIFGGAYVRREICISKSIGLALSLEVNLKFLLCFTLYLRAIF